MAIKIILLDTKGCICEILITNNLIDNSTTYVIFFAKGIVLKI